MKRNLYGSFEYVPTGKLPQPVARSVGGTHRFGSLEFPKNQGGQSMSPLELLEQNYPLPTLGELCRGFFGRKVGAEADEELRESILAKRGYGEWTATWTMSNSGEFSIIERPARIIQNGRDYEIEGGLVTDLPQPDTGWVTKYDTKTGFPIQTSQNKPDAARVFGDEASYFWKNRGGVGAVLRYFPSDDGPFSVHADWRPDDRHSDVGARSCK